ncbi:MAG: leucyl aminopeptidase [Nitrospinae bacterium]|nr:leucyl aminopeptidase [Nitrospinota bacterium]
MKIEIKKLSDSTSELLVLPLFEGEKSTAIKATKEIDTKVNQLIKKKRVEGKAGSQLTFFPEKSTFEGVLIVGFGKKKALSLDVIRNTAAKIYKAVSNNSLTSITVALPVVAKKNIESVRAFVDGFLLSSYCFDKYLSEKGNATKIKTVNIVLQDNNTADKSLQEAIKLQETITNAVFTARDLENTPSADMTPSILAQFAQNMCKANGISISVLNEKQIIAHKMGCLYGVAKGSVEEPRFIIMEYGKSFKKKGTIAVVGKGITFDSGGISLKPGAGMDEMKMDMSGAAATIGILEAVSKLKINKHIMGIIPAAENMPSGNATKPGDILTAMNGKTVEVLNTDAEGRLILADALSYAAKQKPEVIIDLATLTGACLIALGTVCAGIISNNDNVVDGLKKVSEVTGEKIWQLPSFDEYREQIKSKIADLQNIGGKNAGTITAGLFLENFVDNIPWAHIDIAGTAMNAKENDLCPKGGSGFGVKLVTEYLFMKQGKK